MKRIIGLQMPGGGHTHTVCVYVQGSVCVCVVSGVMLVSSPLIASSPSKKMEEFESDAAGTWKERVGGGKRGWGW